MLKVNSLRARGSKSRVRDKGKVKAARVVVAVADNQPARRNQRRVGQTDIREWARFRRKRESGEPVAAVSPMRRHLINLGPRHSTITGEITNSNRTLAANPPAAPVNL